MLPKLGFIWCWLILFAGGNLFAQVTRKVLFLGNSYTAFNNLPQLVSDVASSAGDNLIFDSNTPGGYTLENHSLDITSQNKIMLGGWDYVVLQGQSQEPIVQNAVFNNGGFALDDTITQYNPCSVTMLYMTWGRKNGDASNCASFPVMCTYAGMDTTLRDKYINLAGFLDAEISPVSVVWKYLRQNFPSIELYNADESHPSTAGSYAAACCFYATIFKKDPTFITYDFGLPAADAANIRNAAKIQVFDHLNDWDYFQFPQSGFDYIIGGGINEVIFLPNNGGINQTYFWDFGDGDTSTLFSPAHSYLSNGNYTVSLTTTTCNLTGTYTHTTDTVIQFCAHSPQVSSSHAWLCEYDTLWTQLADSYQWYCAGAPVPVTTQFLPNYHQYPSASFSVSSAMGGCTELSPVYNPIPEWHGYYFDAASGGDPCNGDTALFIIHHVTDTLSPSLVIRWYQDGLLLSSFNDVDTLPITGPGSYQCRLFDPASHCPFDTTVSSEFVVDCSAGVHDIHPAAWVKIYPNPASEILIIDFAGTMDWKEIQLYDTKGSLIKTIQTYTNTCQFYIGDLPNGLYYLRFGNHLHPGIKFIKY